MITAGSLWLVCALWLLPGVWSEEEERRSLQGTVIVQATTVTRSTTGSAADGRTKQCLLCGHRFLTGSDWVPLSRGHVIGYVIPSPGFDLSFEVNLPEAEQLNPDSFANLIHIGSHDGHRLPIISFLPNSLALHVQTSYSACGTWLCQNGIGEVDAGFSRGKSFYKVRLIVSEDNIGGSFKMELFVDDGLVKSTLLGDGSWAPPEHTRIPVYGASPWAATPDAAIRNVQYCPATCLSHSTFFDDDSSPAN